MYKRGWIGQVIVASLIVVLFGWLLWSTFGCGIKGLGVANPVTEQAVTTGDGSKVDVVSMQLDRVTLWLLVGGALIVTPLLSYTLPKWAWHKWQGRNGQRERYKESMRKP